MRCGSADQTHFHSGLRLQRQRTDPLPRIHADERGFCFLFCLKTFLCLKTWKPRHESLCLILLFDPRSSAWIRGSGFVYSGCSDRAKA
jgi:hypothetical protein